MDRYDVVDVYRFAAVVHLAQDRIHAALDELYDPLLDGYARHLGFEAALLAAGADDLVVEEGDMAELSREAVLAVV